MVAPLPDRLEPASVTSVLLGGTWLPIEPGSFSVGMLKLAGESIRNDIWFTAAARDGGGRLSGPFAAIQAVRH